ncbi:RagB/SusD family nutrient uptake outer membrane protein [Fodinibius salsisoli]|uniref:RagB/SusD family nutrient uptake outer membrane protein n=1 Tax=Fodinibius salsisoli TaxID=2820877 RepID=A0ABT3PP60_9BACT|nr:RagB/SusD family nutrient uptake outer membrane protein [Fodinibius salsisoli]MCW9707652.1 RagB/SusD family nutrient uptake outer membrane protein [Fodinibius salsisoli]
MKSTKLIYLFVFLVITALAGCNIVDPDRIEDPNNPSVNEVLEGANKAQLQNLISGLEIRHRSGAMGFTDVIGSFGREIYPMRASDPRNMRDLLGLAEGADAETDPSFRGLGTVWTTPYTAIKQANLIIRAVENTDNVTEEEKSGYLGVAKTLEAFQYLIPLLTQSQENGIRIDVDDPLNPGPFVGYDEALSEIRGLLDEAQTHLEAAGSSFPFNLTEGYADFNTPSTFINLNRAIDARAAIYAEDWSGALASLEEAKPFFELTSGEAAMSKGAYFVYTGPPDAFNPFYYTENAETSQIEMVHPSMITDAEEGDLRVANKFFERTNPITQQGLSSKYQDHRFESNTSPVPWLRNEELILIYAEAQMQQGNITEANEAINYVRNTWGLDNFSGSTPSEVTDQLLYERRYSLWYEFGHRWFDAKRYDRLDELPTDGGKIFNYYARPLSEQNWEDFN